MIKKLTAAVMAMSMTMSFAMPALANDESEKRDDIPVVISSAQDELSLSLDDAIALAMDNNPRIKAADAAIKSAELSLEVAEETQKEVDRMKRLPVSVPDGINTAYLKHGYYPFASKTALELKMMEKEQIKASIAYSVTESYYNVKLMEKLVAIARTSVQIATDNADIVKKNYELGYVSQLEVMNVENSVRKAHISLDSYERNLGIAIQNLKIALQLEGSDVKLILTDEIVLPELPVDVEEKTAAALETRYDVTALKKSMELKQKYFDITDLYVNEKTSLYHTAYSDYVQAEYTYSNTSKLIALSIKSEYSAILTNKESIESAKADVDIKQIEYESAKIKYDMGLITNLELTGVMAELDSAKVQLENAQLTYLLSVLKFNYNTVIGI